MEAGRTCQKTKTEVPSHPEEQSISAVELPSDLMIAWALDRSTF